MYATSVLSSTPLYATVNNNNNDNTNTNNTTNNSSSSSSSSSGSSSSSTSSNLCSSPLRCSSLKTAPFLHTFLLCSLCDTTPCYPLPSKRSSAPMLQRSLEWHCRYVVYMINRWAWIGLGRSCALESVNGRLEIRLGRDY